MALSGLEIQKLLPKTNCKECGSNTCLAFAMKLAAKKANLSECPYASEDAKRILGADSEPPVKTVSIGVNKAGGETVLYRHEKTFVNKPVIAVNINDDSKDIKLTLEEIRDYKPERVGEKLEVEAIALTQKSGSDAGFADLVKKAIEIAGKPVILRAGLSAIKAAAEAVKGTGSVLCGVTNENADDMIAVAKDSGCILAIRGADLDGSASVAAAIKEKGFNDLLIEHNTYSLAEQFQTNTIARRAAIKNKYKPLGYAGIRFIDTEDIFEATIDAVTEIEKYGGVIVLPSFNKAQLTVLMTLRQNIYTDPQKPIQVEPKIYSIGEPDKNSPVFVTTNFSLTYFLVSGEIENSGLSAYLLIPECEGMSVLTAWAAGKFSGAIIAKSAKEMELESLTDCRNIVIPGYVAQISGELEENMPGWKVLVGPQEAGDLEGFIKAVIMKN